MVFVLPLNAAVISVRSQKNRSHFFERGVRSALSINLSRSVTLPPLWHRLLRRGRYTWTLRSDIPAPGVVVQHLHVLLGLQLLELSLVSHTLICRRGSVGQLIPWNIDGVDLNDLLRFGATHSLQHLRPG